MKRSRETAVPTREDAEALIRRSRHELAEMKRAMELSKTDPKGAQAILEALAQQGRASGDAAPNPKRAEIEALVAAKGTMEALRELRAQNEARRRELDNFKPEPPRTHWFTWAMTVAAAGYLAYFFWVTLSRI
jgi:hypothetical protein